MKEENLQASILKFYGENGINPERYTDSMEKHYLEGLDCDSRIYQPNLESALAKWLENYEEKDKAYYLKMFEGFTYLTQRSFEYRVFCLKEYVYKELSTYQQDKIMIAHGYTTRRTMNICPRHLREAFVWEGILYQNGGTNNGTKVFR